MRFELDEDRALLKRSTRELLEKESSLTESRVVMEDSPEGFSKAFYLQLGELGYLSLALPETEGGSEAGSIGLCSVLEEMGRVALPGPYLDLVCGVELLRHAAGDPAQVWRARVSSGERIVLLASAEQANGQDRNPRASRFHDGTVRGTKLFVPYGASADALLVTTREGLVLAERPGAGWNATPLPTLDNAQRFVQIDLNGPAVLLAEPTEAEALLSEANRVGSLGAAAFLLGLMERSLELALGYMMERKAFGTIIGTFQALQHRASDMLLRTESSRAAVYRAAWALESGSEEAALLVAVAKAYAGEAARFVCGEAIQIFGGVGFTWEYDPHIYFKRAKTLEQFYGSTRQQLERALELQGV